MAALRPYVRILVTFVECEGEMQGTKLDQVAQLKAAAVSTSSDAVELPPIYANSTNGANAQIRMALYTGRLSGWTLPHP